jgi:hypothetical protein
MTTGEVFLERHSTTLLASEFGCKPVDDDPHYFRVRKDYVYSKQEYTVPLRVSFGLKFETPGELTCVFREF